MRDRLICLIKNAEKAFPKDKPVLDIEEFVADYILADGIIAPPCRVGASKLVYKVSLSVIKSLPGISATLTATP
jgi:hypothetical protein